jgi:predicted ATPase
MKIGIDRFRCFNHVKALDIRPLTLLVGENSTGKSSFLAGLRFVNELFERGANASLNKDPYSLGSFKDIAHFRGGKAGRADDFAFSISTPISLRRPRGPDGARGRDVDIELIFREVESQPSISSINFTCGEYRAEIVVRDTVTISYQVPGMNQPHSVADEVWGPVARDTSNINAIGFLLNDLPYMLVSQEVRRSPGAAQLQEQAINEFREILRATVSSFPRLVFAGAPVRTKPARTYDNIEAIPSPEGSHIPYLLARLKAFRPTDWERLRDSLNDFGTASGLFSDIDVKKFGPSRAAPFQIAVKIAGPASNLVDVGYGVSQALPVIVETLQASRGSLFLLQQPEVHLHPKAQAALGSYLGTIAKQRGLTIVVETHSDFLIDRVRMDVRDDKGMDPNSVCILFFERTGLDVTVHQLGIDKKGNILKAPPSYRDFFLEEQIRSIA